MTTEKLIDKIRKLLALAESPNEHEAAAAAAMAAQLMQEHQIVEAQLRVEDDDVSAEPILEGYGVGDAGRIVAWRFLLIDDCIKSVGGHSYSAPVKIDGIWQRQLKVFGRESAVQTATYQYEYLTREIERLAHVEYCASGMRENSRSWKNSFCHGAVNRIGKRLREAQRAFEQKVKSAATGTALAIIATDQKACDEAWEIKSSHHHKRSLSGATSASGYAAGQAKGSSIALGGGKGIGAPSKQIGGRS